MRLAGSALKDGNKSLLSRGDGRGKPDFSDFLGVIMRLSGKIMVCILEKVWNRIKFGYLCVYMCVYIYIYISFALVPHVWDTFLGASHFVNILHLPCYRTRGLHGLYIWTTSPLPMDSQGDLATGPSHRKPEDPAAMLPGTGFFYSWIWCNQPPKKINKWPPSKLVFLFNVFGGYSNCNI